ncbi:hypothetical protein [Pseudonocardia humida]|uniref:MmpS family membrane protein n=1 Tax=Pseudonocardia humida TaxID=2800819 RepID=A0ABT1A7F7_9PSEU|nr:hypothetical protein [Pseudonocardia humida]MCO1658945.1 hypothetical protein [Pseudonocardia humida]
MPRLRSAVILMALALVAVGLGGLSVMDPFHLRHARWYTSGAVLLAIVLVTVAFAVVARRGLLRGLVVVVGAVAVVGWVGLVWLASQLVNDSTEVSETAADDRRLVVLEARVIIDPAYAVVVRSGSGPFAQESLVYQGLEGAPAPAARFVDPDSVEVTTPTGCTYRSDIEAVTLAVSPVHRPFRLDTC